MGSSAQKRASKTSTDEQEARRRIEAYIAPVYDAPIESDRPLSVRGACKQLGMSPNTLYKYGLDQRLAAAEGFRTAERQKSGAEDGSRTQRTLQRLKTERDEWKEKYEKLLEAHVHLQHAIQMEPGVNMERVLARRLPKAIRSAPGKGRRNTKNQRS
jgi:hypothetical protein